MVKELKTVERDVSWMYFNHRILEEARKQNVPVLESMSFLGIYSNNLDEFFRVRMTCINRTHSITVPNVGLADGMINMMAERGVNNTHK